MKKLATVAFAISFALPLTSFAAINSIDGLTAPVQQLVSPGPNAANSMHMNIVNVGADTHRFKWDGSAWAVNQGGTGSTGPLVNGGVLFYDAATNAFAQSNSVPTGEWLHWNKDFGQFEIGGFGDGQNNIEKIKLFMVDSTSQELGGGVAMAIRDYASVPSDNGAMVRLETARGTLNAPAALENNATIGNIDFAGYNGSSFTGFPPAQVRADAEENWTPAGTGARLVFSTNAIGTTGGQERMRIAGNGNVGIGTDDPQARLHVFAPADVGIVKIDGTQGCLAIKDLDGIGFTYITVNNGTLFATTTPCN